MAELFKFRCVNCQKLIGVPTTRYGKVIKCPHCQADLIVPTPDSSDEAPGLEADSLDLDLNLDDLSLKPASMTRAPLPSELAVPNPVGFLERVATESEQPDDSEVSEDEENLEEPPAILPVARSEPLTVRRRGASEVTSRARDVIVPRTAFVAWSLFGLLAMGMAFATGLLIGHFLWKS